MKLTLGFSPCPNDTFIFDALVNKKIDTAGLEFDVVLEDVETLNQWALEGKLDITKLSFPAFFQSLDKYKLLNTGSALGRGVGPLLITNKKQGVQNNEVNDYLIALPGINTTAHLLFSFAYPEALHKIFMRFDKIEDFVLSGATTPAAQGLAGVLGVIIHENRFTYQEKGLHQVADLGEIWEQKMKAPIPLGGIAIKKTIEKEKAKQVDWLIMKSLSLAFKNYPQVTDYVKKYSQTMSEEVMRKHIDLYVNSFTLHLGSTGVNAIKKMYEIFQQIHRLHDKRPLRSFIIS